ncbi:TonB-dependent receptor [Sphingomonas sp. So64.6b]|uniref:TonB-dependent receptor n=1 Tax=Sphingomonas sp. So64.6b TaxID=2997354 RepID=UPI0015FFF562|nr:TonB-dependent receptor [Sphingomonas sp. So64.6b]
MRRLSFVLFLMATTAAMPVMAQDVPRQAPPETAQDTDPDAIASDEPDIVVTGSRNLPGSVIGDIPPEKQIGAAEIRSYGVSSISDLLDELAPLTGSGRGSGGAPVVLLDGKRISGFSEIRDIPTEAIQRVEILPEEVALKYGYPADQKVVNVVLRRRFKATTVEAQDKLATAGARNTAQGDLDLLTIRRGGRFNLHVKYQDSSALTEAERDINPQPSLFSTQGNIVGVRSITNPNGEIDPLLSAQAGSLVSIAGVPASAANGAPVLGDFAATAGQQTFSDPSAYRTLLPSSRNFSANAVYARTILGNVSATVNGTIETTESVGTNGLPGVSLALAPDNPFSPFANAVTVDRSLDGFAPLKQRNSSVSGHLGTTLNGTISTWQWSLTGTYDRSENKTVTDAGLDISTFQARLNAGDPTANPFGRLGLADVGAGVANRAYATSSNLDVDALFTGTLFALPAGSVATSIKIGGQTSDFSGRTYRANIVTPGDVSRDIVNGQINIDIPIANKSKDVLGILGKLSANFNIAADHLSDFGTLTTLGYGANWSPVEGVRLIVSHTDQDRAPSAQQLANPLIITPNVRVFDYVRGETATVTTMSGGNPELRADNNHVTKIGLTLNPFGKTDLTLTATYVKSRTDDPSASFPSASSAIEAAFPDRFVREATGTTAPGRLISVDTRPINFARSERSELRWGINFSKSLKSKVQKELEAFREGTGPNPFAGLRRPGQDGERGGRRGSDGASGDRPDGGAPGAAPAGGGAPDGDRPRFGGGRGGAGGFGGRGGGRRGGGGGGRLQFGIFHTWHLTDKVLIADGGPSLDLLNGDAIGGSGGQSRHEVQLQAGYTNNGAGLRLSGNYRSGTRVNGGTPGAPEPLAFSALTTLNVRLFADLGQRLDLLKKHPWLRGTRITLAFDNVFDSRQRVTDVNGATPISYQPDYLDPLGRTVKLSIRKLF